MGEQITGFLLLFVLFLFICLGVVVVGFVCVWGGGGVCLFVCLRFFVVFF